MKRRVTHWTFRAGLPLVLAAFPFQVQLAHAQTTDTDAAGSEALSDIIVTAQRRGEKAVDVPISLTTLNDSQLVSANVQQLSDITRLTPSLRFDTVGSYSQPTIRGVGTALVTSGGGSNVGIYADGFYSSDPLAADMQLSNVENVQVLKGPQGTLFGRNTTGGAILITTAEPSVDPRGSAEVSYGRFNSLKMQGYATAGISDGVALDIEGLYRRGNGFVTNIVSGRHDPGRYENWLVRAGAKIDISPDLSLLMRYRHGETDDPTSGLTNAYVLGGRPLTPSRNIPGAVVATRPGEISINQPVYFHSKSNNIQGTLRWDGDFATVTSYTQYERIRSHQTIDIDLSSAPVAALILNNQSTTVTQELLLTSKPGSRLQWTAGLFYFNYEDTFEPAGLSFGGGPFNTLFASNTRTRSIAGFVDLTYELTDRLFLTAGGRYSHDEVADAYFLKVDLSGYTFLPTLKKNTFTPRAVLRFKPNASSSLYISYSKGYKAPIYNVGGNSVDPIDAETINAFEAGYKYSSRGLSFEAAGYYYKYKDLQVAAYNGTQSLINNAGKARIYGAEGQIGYDFGGGMSFNAGAAYTNAKYTEYLAAPSFIVDPATIDGTGFILNSTTDASGNRMQRAPGFTGNLGLRYETDLAGGKLGLSGNYYYTSKIYFDPARQFAQDGYGLLNLRAQWTNASDLLTLAIYGDNLTNSQYLTQVTGGPFGIRAVWGYPRTYGASAKVRF